jgi:hypothetical protein
VTVQLQLVTDQLIAELAGDLGLEALDLGVEEFDDFALAA